ncbi:MAG: putative Ig domain-containing protein [Nitrospirae bacterium]|nr:putative Ig domain-containing protein [Nitrospirota bacterium]
MIFRRDHLLLLIVFPIVLLLASPVHSFVFTPENPTPGPMSVSLSLNAGQSQGATLAVDVRVNVLSDAPPAWGAAFDLDFDPAVLTYAGFIPGDFFEGTDQPENGSLIRLVMLQAGASGKLVVGISQNFRDPGRSGNGAILTLKFTVAASPQTLQSDLSFSNMNLLDPRGVAIDGLIWYKGRVAQLLLTLLTSEVVQATEGKRYTASLAASGGFPPYTWNATGSAAPSGLTLNPDTGAITGVPSSSGAYSMTVHLTDTAGQEVRKDLTFVVNPPPVITTPSIAPATAGLPYQELLVKSGGTDPSVWGIASGTLPPGIQLDPQAGGLSGTPTSVGAYSFTLRLVDANGAESSAGFSMPVTAGPSITAETLSRTPVGANFMAILLVSGGTPPYTWEIPVGLPPGLSLIPEAGEILGIPASAGNWRFIAGVRDANGVLASKDLEILVNPAPSVITSGVSSLYQGSSGGAVTFEGSGGVAPYTWSVVSGSLPPGLILDPQTGAVSGIPEAPGLYTFSLQVMDAAGVVSSMSCTWAILAIPPGNVDFTTEGSEVRVDGYDLIALEVVFGTTLDSPAWNPMADLDGNGIIDDADFLILQTHFGFSERP